MKRVTRLKELVLVLLSIFLVIIITKELCVINRFCYIFKLLFPVFIGFLYAWFMNPLIDWFGRKIKRNYACIIVFLSLIFVLSLFLYYLVPIVYREVNELVNILPKIMDLVKMKFSEIGLYKSIDSFYHTILNNLPKFILSGVRSIFSSLGTLAIGLMLGLYISMDYNRVIELIYKCIPKQKKCVVITLLQEISTQVRRSIYGTMIVATLVFVLDSIVFLIFHVDATLLLGLFCGLTDLIPYVGPYIGTTLAVIVALTESKKVAICVLIGCIIVQCLENYLLQPLIMSKSIKIHPAFIMIGILVFGSFFGVLGMIAATPIVAIIKVIIDYIDEVRQKCKES